MFEIICTNPVFVADSTVCKVIILKNKEMGQENVPDFIVFMAERSDNKGKSVTNNIERIAGKIWDQNLKIYDVDPGRVAWVEMYPENEPPTESLVTFRKQSGDPMVFSDPIWEEILQVNPDKLFQGE